jgi:hypothetical protein
VTVVDVEQVRAVMRLIGNEHITPVGRRQIEKVLQAAEGADLPFQVGDAAMKKSGYPFQSEVRAVFTTRAGKVRLVCESVVIHGLLHIFNTDQMRPMHEEES